MRVLLHIGYGKAASTTLQDWFERHPEIWRFSEKGLVKGAAADKKVCVLSDERLSLGLAFDATSGLIANADSIKAYQSSRCQELRDLFPDAYVLIVTRGFSQFLESFYAQYVSKGGVLFFSEFLTDYANPILDLLDYNYLIGTYQEAFGDRVITIPVELLKSDADRFYGIIESRLGLAADKRSSAKKLNARIDSRRLRALPLFSRLFFRLLRPFSPTWQRILQKIYVRHLARGRLGLYMSRLVPERFLPSSLLSDLDVSRFEGFADILATREIYSAFKSDYLLKSAAVNACGTIKD
ncbi:hypothetical protein J5J83_07800 [Azoarcus sp. L1K30]|uniref:hypothetical protein n=1 Tax=Azoarcus sp. L1K30 TaxID=2820277 RepID=UPI001B82CAE4|nr:hypothetical protein [Azoarcus sp. L1K30]MBR0566015.1 hypothetical protein [Azoarcus sp. L1K30]